MIHSLDIERRVLSGILQHQESWCEVSSILTNDDFYSNDSKVHQTIFKMLRAALDNSEAIDETILIEKINQLGVSFPDSIDVPEYIQNLAFIKITKDVFLSSVKELKKISVRRLIFEKSEEIRSFVKSTNPELSYSQIVDKADSIHNEAIAAFEFGDDKVVNLAEIAEEIVEDRGENPPEEVGFMSPYKTINKIYGSLFRPGNITAFAARAKVGKTSLMLDMVLKVSAEYGVPVLHFDNGEMSEEELVFRMVAANSGIPVYLLESGKWRTHGYDKWSAEEVVEKVRATWKKIKDIRLLYKNVAGMSSEEMIAALKRLYYSEVGRGNEMILSFDYLKTDFNNIDKGSGWAFLGKTIHEFKQCIQRDLKFDGKPVVSMVTSIQTNRAGITTNKSSADVTDDESVIGLTDQLIQFASHIALLRKKTTDELVDEGSEFGTHKLIFLAARHLGEDAFGHINDVELTDGSLKRNFINLAIENFNVEDCGDLRDIVNKQKGIDLNANTDDDDDDGFLDDF